MNGDLLDEYCMNELGHTDWEIVFDEAGNYIVTFYNQARNSELEEIDE
jgi:hypothetical protein